MADIKCNTFYLPFNAWIKCQSYRKISLYLEYKKNHFVDNDFLARDARELRNYISKIQPSVDLSYDYEDQRGNVTTIDIPVGIDFFWPEATV